jgi:hypothetical protein
MMWRSTGVGEKALQSPKFHHHTHARHFDIHPAQRAVAHAHPCRPVRHQLVGCPRGGSPPRSIHLCVSGAPSKFSLSFPLSSDPSLQQPHAPWLVRQYKCFWLSVTAAQWWVRIRTRNYFAHDVGCLSLTTTRTNVSVRVRCTRLSMTTLDEV